VAATKPTFPLSRADDSLQFNTQPAFWGLNHGLGCSPLGLEAYPPEPVSQGLRRLQIRSLIGKRDLSTPYFPFSALPCRQPRLGLGCDPLRRELAITGLDWSLAPSPRSEERIEHQYPFGPPPGFRLASPYPGLDRPVSSVTAVTPGPFRLSASPA
jgi:hypothetical protein